MAAQSGIDESIRAIFHRLFKVAPTALTDSTRRGQLETWDSLGHLELLEALRKDLGVTIAPEQALEMETFADVRRVVSAFKATAG